MKHFWEVSKETKICNSWGLSRYID